MIHPTFIKVAYSASGYKIYKIGDIYEKGYQKNRFGKSFKHS